jgi:hypothetical protein
MEPCTHFKERGNPAIQEYPPTCWPGDLRKNFQECRFSRTIITDYPKYITPVNGEGNILQGPKRIAPLIRQMPAIPGAKFLKKTIQVPGECTGPDRSETIPLGNLLTLNHPVSHT